MQRGRIFRVEAAAMSEMVERVTRALQANNDGHWSDMARAAIEVMREPTPEMIEAGWIALNSMSGFDEKKRILAIWTIMIREALK
jgi:hypothetical protein